MNYIGNHLLNGDNIVKIEIDKLVGVRPWEALGSTVLRYQK